MPRTLIAAGKRSATTERAVPTNTLPPSAAETARHYAGNAARAILTTQAESALPFREVRDAKVANLRSIVKRLDRTARDLPREKQRQYEAKADIWRAVITEIDGATLATVRGIAQGWQ